MSLPQRTLLRTLIAPLLTAICTSGCATLFYPRAPVVRIRTDSVVATVRTARGDTLGTTPLEARIRPRERQDLVLTAPGYDSAVVTIGSRTKPVLITLLNPFSVFVDGLTGAAWEHDPGSLDVTMTASPVTEAPAERVDELPDAVAAVVLDELADVAEDAGCEPLLVEAWRDAAYVLANGDSAAQPVPDSVRRIAADEVGRRQPEIREICARPSRNVDELRRIRETLEDTTVAVDESPPLLSPVYFGLDEWMIRDDSVRARLRTVGARLRDEPMSLIVEGFADGAELRHRELGAQRALSVIRELQAGGMGTDCCIAISNSGNPAAMEDAAEAWLNRRVTFTLDYRRSP